MQQSQRVFYNHALNFAIEKANNENIPLYVLFVLIDDFPEAQAAHYVFMLEGLIEVRDELAIRGIPLIFHKGDPVDIVSEYSKKASCIVFDTGYLRLQKTWRNAIRERVEKNIFQVESDVVVPVEIASNKREYMARTLRPKISESLKDILKNIDNQEDTRSCLNKINIKIKNKILKITPNVSGHITGMIENILDSYRKDSKNMRFTGGHSAAVKQFAKFLQEKLPDYSERSNHPGDECVSLMSPYLHFGQISPLELITMISQKYNLDKPFVQDYLEQLVVRRELAMNFVHYSEDYDSMNTLPGWAKGTLKDHADDKRDYLYTYEEFEQGKTHDTYWNACMKEMRETGFMHGYMRMYWGKKIIEWTDNPDIAYKTIISLNNKYFLDGRDPVSYASILWLFGLHDQAWQERPVFGKIRYMNYAGLKRKFDMKKYIERLRGL